MKKTALTTIISILLIVAGVFALAAVGFGVRDGLAIKQYKEDDAKAADVVGDLEKAIDALKANEEDYLKGVGTYNKGLSDFSAGQQAYNAGKAELNQGYMDYEAGKKALEEGRAKIAAGQAQIDANTDAYNDGKAMLAKIEPLMPYLDQYVSFRDGSLGKLPGFGTAQGWFVAVVRPIASRMGLDIPNDVNDFPKYMQDMVAAGKAQLKEYEDGLAQLEAGKAELAAGEAALAEAEKQLAAGEAALATGANDLADGAAKLAAGKADLEAFEAGMALVDEYTMVCFKNAPIYRYDGSMAVPGPEQRLGADFDWKKYDESGQLVKLRNGDPYLDLDQCLVVCKSFRESVADHVADVTNELTMRLALYVALAVAGILGIVGGALALAGRKVSAVLGIVTAVLAVGCNIFGLFTRYHGYTYPLKDGTYSGTLQLVGLITFAAIAIVFAIVAVLAKKDAAREVGVVEAEM